MTIDNGTETTSLVLDMLAKTFVKFIYEVADSRLYCIMYRGFSGEMSGFKMALVSRKTLRSSIKMILICPLDRSNNISTNLVVQKRT